MWGKTVDNINTMDVVLSDGSTTQFGPVSGSQLSQNATFQLRRKYLSSIFNIAKKSQ